MAKKLTLELYEKIIDAVYEKSLSYLGMLGHVTRDECAEYIGFYAHHGGLFWSEQNGGIAGVATGHPGKRDFNWQWGADNGIWTAHLVWGENIKAQADVLRQFLETRQTPVRELWAWRRGKPTQLTKQKLERIFSYGRKSKNPGSSSASVQRVNEKHSQGAGGDGSRGLRTGGGVPTEVPATPVADAGEGGCGSDRALSETTA